MLCYSEEERDQGEQVDFQEQVILRSTTVCRESRSEACMVKSQLGGARIPDYA